MQSLFVQMRKIKAEKQWMCRPIFSDIPDVTKQADEEG